jgi:hypothetical protein
MVEIAVRPTLCLLIAKPLAMRISGDLVSVDCDQY